MTTSKKYKLLPEDIRKKLEVSIGVGSIEEYNGITIFRADRDRFVIKSFSYDMYVIGDKESVYSRNGQGYTGDMSDIEVLLDRAWDRLEM
jgi:hypothetical protein